MACRKVGGRSAQGAAEGRHGAHILRQRRVGGGQAQPLGFIVHRGAADHLLQRHLAQAHLLRHVGGDLGAHLLALVAQEIAIGALEFLLADLGPPTVATAAVEAPVKTSAMPQTTKLRVRPPIRRVATQDLERVCIH